MRPQVKTTVFVSILSLSLALNLSFAIGYLGNDRSGGESNVESSGGADIQCLLDMLDLDKNQQKRLSGMRQRMNEKRVSFWQRSSEIKTALASAICDSSRSRLDSLLDNYAENQASMQRAVANHLTEVNEMLRPEQRESFRKLLMTGMFRGIRPTRAGDKEVEVQ